MTAIVSVKFKKDKDYSNEHKDSIIFTLPGIYRVSRDFLDDMNKGGVHHFKFKNESVAGDFAKKLFYKMNNILEITTNFTIEEN